MYVVVWSGYERDKDEIVLCKQSVDIDFLYTFMDKSLIYIIRDKVVWAGMRRVTF